MWEVTACNTKQEGEEEIVEYNSMRDTLYIIKLRQLIVTLVLRLSKIRHWQLPYNEVCVFKYLLKQCVETNDADFTMSSKF
jgi:hypothetical protein